MVVAADYASGQLVTYNDKAVHPSLCLRNTGKIDYEAPKKITIQNLMSSSLFFGGRHSRYGYDSDDYDDYGVSSGDPYAGYYDY